MQRQDSGTTGRIENGRVGVLLGDASRHGRAPIDRALDLPARWAKAPARRAAAGIPEAVRFTTKPRLGRALLAPALEAGCRLPG